MRKLALLVSTIAAAGSAAAIPPVPPPPPPKAPMLVPMAPYGTLQQIIAPVRGADIKRIDEKLVSFGTRHTLSSQTDPKRGIGAALNWADSQFKSFGLQTVRPCDTFQGERVPTPTKICDAVAIQRGTERPNDVVIITAHIDSRVSDVMNVNAVEPGANDDGSGSSAIIEAAKVLSKHKFPGTIVYSLDSGEEQGLYGAKVIAAYARAQGWNVIANLNNDIIGNSCGSDGVCDDTHVRVFSEGPRWQGHDELAKAMRAFGGENDAPSRNISRFLDGLADHLNIGLDVRQVWRNDRFGRGGDHTEFLNLGFPAVRLTVAVENYNWQHQDLRTENGVVYGDTIDHMDFNYLEKVAKLNIAALAAIASAPPPPEPKAEGAVSTDTTLTWDVVKGARGYVVRWRPTDAANWTNELYLPAEQSGTGITTLDVPPSGVFRYNQATLPHVRVDDWVFGVSSVSKEGFESPVASAVPGGAFKPYVAGQPAKK